MALVGSLVTVANEYCRSMVESGLHVSHHCGAFGQAGESAVLSIIVYRFGCAALA